MRRCDLREACTEGNIDMINKLLFGGYDLNMKGFNGMTPIHSIL